MRAERALKMSLCSCMIAKEYFCPCLLKAIASRLAESRDGRANIREVRMQRYPSLSR